MAKILSGMKQGPYDPKSQPRVMGKVNPVMKIAPTGLGASQQKAKSTKKGVQG